MSDIDLDALAAAAKAATPGPWETVDARESMGRVCLRATSGATIVGYGSTVETEEDAEYIAAVNPEAVLALIARVRAAESPTPRPRDGDLGDAIHLLDHQAQCYAREQPDTAAGFARAAAILRGAR